MSKMSQSSSTYVCDYSPEEIKKAHEVLYNEGLRMRIQVAGKEYVEKALSASKDPFSKPMQEVCICPRRTLQDSPIKQPLPGGLLLTLPRH